MTVLGIVIMIAVLVCFAALGIYQLVYLLRLPRRWIMKGIAPPDHVDVALRVIRGMLPERPRRWGGYVTWTGGPIPFKDPDGTQHMAGGIMNNAAVHDVTVQWFENVWQTALAHELIHVFTGWADGDPRLQPLVEKMNAEIKKQLAAVV